MPEDDFISRNGWTVAFNTLPSNYPTIRRLYPTPTTFSKLVPEIWSTAILV